MNLSTRSHKTVGPVAGVCLLLTLALACRSSGPSPSIDGGLLSAPGAGRDALEGTDALPGTDLRASSQDVSIPTVSDGQPTAADAAGSGTSLPDAETTTPAPDADLADAPVAIGGACEPGATMCGPTGGIRSCVAVGGSYQVGPEVPCAGHRICNSSAGKASCECPQVPSSCQHDSFDCSASKLTLCGRDPDGCAYVVSETPCVPPENGHAQCLLGSCQRDCNAGLHLCNDKCVAEDDATACGFSCISCPPAPRSDPNSVPACKSNTCVVGCRPGYHQCGAFGTSRCEIDTSVDSCGQNCGPCNRQSDAVATCDGKTCGYTCNAGFVPCPFGCLDTKGNDIRNCGACGKMCNEACRAGVCYETKVILSDTFDDDTNAWQYDAAWNPVVLDSNPTQSMKCVSGGFNPCGPADLLWKTDFSLVGAVEASVVFSYKADGSPSDEFQILASTDGGTSWAVAGMVPRHALEWTTANVDLKAYLGQPSVRVGFRMVKSCMDTLVQWWSVDSVEIRAMSPMN